MTQVCHQIRCLRAPEVDSEAFGEITEVVPWDILALDCDQNLNDDQVCSPRLFKSHESRQHIAPGARYVCVVRDPVDVFWSFYNFLPPYMGVPAGAVTPEDFADAVFAGASHSGHCWHHFLGWYDAAREDTNVLVVCFEDMREDLASCARLVAKHAGVDDVSDDEIAAVVERSGFEYMRARAGQFDDHFVRRKMWTRVGIDESEWGEGGVGKVREGAGRWAGARRACRQRSARKSTTSGGNTWRRAGSPRTTIFATPCDPSRQREATDGWDASGGDIARYPRSEV